MPTSKPGISPPPFFPLLQPPPTKKMPQKLRGPVDSGGPADATGGRVNSSTAFSLDREYAGSRLKGHQSIAVQSSISTGVSRVCQYTSYQLLCITRYQVVYDSGDIKNNILMSCLDHNAGGHIHCCCCCLPDERCRDIKQPAEKNAIFVNPVGGASSIRPRRKTSSQAGLKFLAGRYEWCMSSGGNLESTGVQTGAC